MLSVAEKKIWVNFYLSAFKCLVGCGSTVKSSNMGIAVHMQHCGVAYLLSAQIQTCPSQTQIDSVV